ncbi:unnamed protein product [Effrenium voratum]|nr:unnamed protein product [Effrenium voratum]
MLERLALMKKELPKKRSRRQGQNESVARSRVLPQGPGTWTRGCSEVLDLDS